MTNRAFIPTVRWARRAQGTIRGSAAKQRKETERESTPNLSKMPTLWYTKWQQEKGNQLHHKWSISTLDCHGSGEKG